MNYLIRLARRNPLRKIILITADCVFIIISVLFSFFLRFDWKIPNVNHALWFAALNIVFIIPIFNWQKLYNLNLTFFGTRDLYKMFKALFLSWFCIIFAVYILRDFFIINSFPRSILFINLALLIIFLNAIRISKRIVLELRSYKSGKRIVIVGAGDAGEQLARKMLLKKEFTLVGFLDDSENKKKTTIHGIPVLGSIDDLPSIHKKYGIEELIIAIPSAEQKTIKKTVDLARNNGIKNIKIVPGIIELLNGKFTLHDIREVSVEDLLGRTPIKFDMPLLENFIKGKKVCITGAAGSIGQELLKKILLFNPSKVLAIDHEETGVFRITELMRRHFPHISFHPSVADIGDHNKIDYLFDKHSPEIVLHAAAYKHVPVMEHSPEEAIKTNIFGTLNLIDQSIRYGVKNFVIISTDKAVNPTSIMGASKRFAELLMKRAAIRQNHSTKFCAVRFGNVLDSRGNVIEIFKEQIKKGGPIEVTHPEMKRFFMLTQEAVMLVLEAGALSQGGEIFVLDMGEPVKIADLAREMIRLSGFEPDKDIPIVFSAPRPGEKLFEEILTKNEQATKLDKIYINRENHKNLEQIELSCQQLKELLMQKEYNKIKTTLFELIK